MPKSFLRIVVWLLVPSLVADPVLAISQKNPLSSNWERATVEGRAFLCEALAPAESGAVQTRPFTKAGLKVLFWLSQLEKREPSVEKTAFHELQRLSFISTGINGVVVKHRITGKSVLFFGKWMTGKSASADLLTLGQPLKIPIDTWQLVAHQTGTFLRLKEDPTQLFYRQESKFDRKPLEHLTDNSQGESQWLKNGVLATGEAVRIDAIVLFSDQEGSLSITRALPNTPEREKAVQELAPLIAPENPERDEVKNALIQPSAVPLFVINSRYELSVPTAQFQTMTRELNATLEAALTSLPTAADPAPILNSHVESYGDALKRIIEKNPWVANPHNLLRFWNADSLEEETIIFIDFLQIFFDREHLPIAQKQRPYAEHIHRLSNDQLEHEAVPYLESEMGGENPHTLRGFLDELGANNLSLSHHMRNPYLVLLSATAEITEYHLHWLNIFMEIVHRWSLSDELESLPFRSA